MKSESNLPGRLSELESRLRAEARQAPASPSPHLRSRIMAEVTSIEAAVREGEGRDRMRRVAVAAGAVAILLVTMLSLHHWSPGTASAPPGLAEADAWQNLVVGAESVPDQLQAVVANPFRGEVAALASDAERATRFLTACIPL